MKNIFTILFRGIVCTSLFTSAHAQIGYFQDIYRFGSTQFLGTARMQAIGGAQVALGGDLSAAIANPAGLGLFNRNMFTITPSMDFQDVESTFLGSRQASFDNRFYLGQMGVTLHWGKGDIVPDKFKGGTFAIGLQRISNFNRNFVLDGRDSKNSIVDSFIERAGNNSPSLLDDFTFTAYDHFLIDQADYSITNNFIVENGLISANPGDGTVEGYASLFGAFPGVLPRQNENVETIGGQYQVSFANGFNYDDKVYFGLGLGILSVDYKQRRNFRETDFRFSDGTPDDLVNFIEIRDQLTVNGSGINLSVGMIARPIEFVTLGINYTTASYYNLTEESEFTFTTDWNSAYSYITGDDTLGLGRIVTNSNIFTTDYNLKTPGKLTTGAAVFLGKYGFISADLEWQDLSNGKITSNDFITSEDNQAILETYNQVMSYRLGTELRLDEMRIRAGYNYQADPFVTREIDRSVSTWSFGAGYRNKDYFVDLALSTQNTKDLYASYFLQNDSPIAYLTQRNTTATLTFGFIF